MGNVNDSSQTENENGVKEYKAGNLEQALAHFEQAFVMDAGNIDARRNFADVCLQLSRFDEAVRTLVQIIKDYPNDTETLVTLGKLYHEAGRNEDAALFFKRALQYDPGNKAASEALQLVGAGQNMDEQPVDHAPTDAARSGRPPRVSIIIPVYNQVAYTKQCIESLRKNTSIQDYEIIVADDASTDETASYLDSIRDVVRVIRNKENMGFIRNCNNAASQARGEYLVFLNNDTIPQPGWLEALIELAEADRNVAIVGAKMIWPDGRLLEASSVVFSDGSAWNFGRGESPNQPKYNHVREADYVSGGGMLIRSTVWKELGGFDTLYCPAYYDDIDLCFAARKAGYKVLYTPFSQIIHFEGMTGGRDVTQGVKRYQVVNQEKFRKKWAAELQHQYARDPRNVNRASWRGDGKRVLVIDHMFPLPNLNSGCLRMNHLMKTLVGLGQKVTYAALVSYDPGNYKIQMQKMGVETASLSYEIWRSASLAAKAPVIESILNGLEVDTRRYDIVYFSFYWVAMHFIDQVSKRLPNAIIYVDSHDIHFLRTQREAELYKDGTRIVRAGRTKTDELAVYSKADAVLTVTEQDREALAAELPHKPVFLMPNVHDVVGRERDFDERKDLLFIGAFDHDPNTDAMLYFCTEIFPKVKHRLPEVRLLIVGSNPTKEVKDLQNESITVTGWVENIKAYIESCRISIAPLRYGAGMKGKVGEAMASGLPVVTSPVGGEGMGIVSGEHALVVDSVDEWVESIVRLYSDSELWHRLSAKGQDLMSQRYSSNAMQQRVEQLLAFSSKEELQTAPGAVGREPGKKGVDRAVKPDRPEETKKRNILVIDPFLPFFDRAAGSLHLFNILRVLKDMDFRITYIATNKSLSAMYKPVLEGLGIETFVGDQDGMRHFGYDVTYPKIDYSSMFAERQFDCALIDFWYQAEYYLPIIRKYSPRTRIIVDTEDVHFVREIREAELKGDSALKSSALEKKGREVAIYKEADYVWVVTEEDRQALLKENVEVPIDIRPVIHDLPSVKNDFSGREGLLFVGNFSHGPNIDAVRFFVKEVLPKVRRSIPEVRLYIVGNDPGNQIASLTSADIVGVGYVQNLSDYYEKCRVAVAPLRYGAGLKGKIVESLSYGVPVVTTSIGVEGTGLKDDEDVLVADDPDEMAGKIIEVYKNRITWERLSQDGRSSMESKWSFAAGKKRLEEILLPVADEKRTDVEKLSSIVILTYNQLDYTKKTIDSIRRHTRTPYEIIVVDNASSDGTVEYLKAQKDIHTIFNEENLGFPAGCNQGMEIAKGDYIVLLNNDVIVTDDWLEGLIECSGADPKVGIVGPRTNWISGYQLEREITYKKVSQVPAFAAKYRRKNRRKWIEVPRVAGFCMLIKRDVLENIGGLDTVFGIGNCEDDDYCLRSKLSGFKVALAGDVFIHHFGSKSFNQKGLEKYLDTVHANEKVFEDKWGVDPAGWWRDGKAPTKTPEIYSPYTAEEPVAVPR